MGKQSFDILNSIAIKNLENLPEVDFSEVSEGGPYKVRPVELALIKDRSHYDSIDGTKWDLVGIAGKVTTVENLKLTRQYKPYIVASTDFEDDGTIDFMVVSSKRYFSEIFGYRPLTKIDSKESLEIKHYLEE